MTQFSNVLMLSLVAAGILQAPYAHTDSPVRYASFDCVASEKDCGEFAELMGDTEMSNSGQSGHCTWGAKEMFYRTTGIRPALYGHAKDWRDSAPTTGWTVAPRPTKDSIVVFQPTAGGADAVYGHVGWVEHTAHYQGDTWIYIREMNFYRFGQWSQRWVKHTGDMSYILTP